jgi:DnaK suppressor protein
MRLPANRNDYCHASTSTTLIPGNLEVHDKGVSTMNLHAVRTQLLATKAELEQRLHRTRSHIHHKDTPVSQDFDEQAVEMQNDEVVHMLDFAGRKELEQIDLALQRLDEGTYQFCAGCGKPIEEERLIAVPYTELCIECIGEQ